MKLRLRLLLVITLYSGVLLNAQIFPDKSGDELYISLVDEFKPNYVELYSNARLRMYKEIYNIQDTVHTLYSGHKLYLPPNEPLPIQYLAQEATKDGINTEHIYPRSKGALEENGNAFSDLHNLAPVRWEVNESRANFPFGEIDDDQTQCWFRRNDKVTDLLEISSEEIDEYSEMYSEREVFRGVFEPREAVKGDVARSVFYFYTMYRKEAIEADPNYFETMRKTLCEWHNTDVIDEIEAERNLIKAKYQDGQANPFILDCTLANRMYCEDFKEMSCDQLTTAIAELQIGQRKAGRLEPVIKVLPNPNTGIFTLDITSLTPGDYRMEVFYASGQLLYSIEERFDLFNSINMWNAKNGMHYIHLTDLNTGRRFSGTFVVVR